MTTTTSLKTLILLSLLVTGCLAQNDTGTTSNATVPQDMNMENMATAQSPLVTGNKCKYQWYPEFNVLHTMCFDGNGMPSKTQMRIVQQPISKCSVQNNNFILALHVENIARFFVKPTDGTYFCCDIYEPGYGYLFTDCGGSEMIVLNDRLNDNLYKDQQKVLGFTYPLWNFTELQALINAKCNNTYKVVDEYAWGGEYQIWMTLNLPWQNWMTDMNIQDLQDLKVWLVRYYQFLQAYFISSQQANETQQAANIQALINSFDPAIVDMTITEIAANYSMFLNNFTQWFSNISSQAVQSQPGLAAIPPGYRAIVRWVRTHMIQELHVQIAVQVNQTLPSGGGEIPPPSGLNTGAGGINGGDFGDQTYNNMGMDSPALTSGGSNQNLNPFGSGV
ncbi:UNKNOWN [Stylonychia lemnae]|uniref:Uncharacterized protein n=1 Tax=Stylonychia lemnae TaxID=5949 RepID=A0A078B5P7_STYLE|nr:UNKNOWN [Stylonychia lemnae]|eukprot:CDW89739.1 UNKNOWN [Stylonychia lemnae]